MWTPSQRRTLIGLIVVLSTYLLIRSAFNKRYVPDPQPTEPPRMHELADRLDPNTATLAELIVLPQMGEKRAGEIIAYRDRYQRDHPGEIAFKRPDDLLKIKGIGQAMVQTFSPHLTFPTTQPSAGL